MTTAEHVRDLALWDSFENEDEDTSIMRVPGGVLVTKTVRNNIQHISPVRWQGTCAASVAMTTTFVPLPPDYFRRTN